MEKIITPLGEVVCFEPSIIGVVSNLSTSNFSLKPGNPFRLKNDGDLPVKLEVRLSKMNNDEFIETKFDLGWNPEIIVEIKQTSTSVDLKWGY